MRFTGFRFQWMALLVVLTIAAYGSIGGFLRAGLDDDPVRRFSDPAFDAAPRPTNPGPAAPFDPRTHHLPDLIEVRLGAWEPDAPALDLFAGEFVNDDSDADFFRLDLAIRGLANPPGDVRPKEFDPFAFGPHPIYGFVELDMDRNVNTGGELDAPEYRYLGNIVRFGGDLSDERLRDRAALDAGAFDHDMNTPPFVDRSGEEFHLALLGGEFGPSDVSVIAGNSDQSFEAGETWRIAAPFFHRAHGFEEFSFAQGGQYPGSYLPTVLLQFAHLPISDQTVISLVFPTTQTGAGRQRNVSPEPLDGDPTNQASLHEALYDLQVSAQFLKKFPSGHPYEEIILAWADEEPAEFLGPGNWAITVLLGTSYSQSLPGGVYYVWSDAYPNVVRGDVNGNGETDGSDVERIEDFIEDFDSLDGAVDGAVVIADFATDFSVFDVNHDGLVDGLDLLCDEADGDGDDDDDVDLRDFSRLQQCFQIETLAMPECVSADLDLSGVIDLDDLPWFNERFEGPRDP